MKTPRNLVYVSYSICFLYIEYYLQVDAIVNTTSTSLNLNMGATSKSIVKAAGSCIQTEVNQKAPNGIQFGEMVSSSGGNTSCKRIYHVALCSWEHVKGNSEQVCGHLIL